MQKGHVNTYVNLCKQSQSRRVKLNIGGIRFETTLDTVTREKPTFLSSLVDGLFMQEPEEDGSYFIDRSPRYFDIVLDYLRKGSIYLERFQEYELRELEEEASFYQIQSLVDILTQASRTSKCYCVGGVDSLQRLSTAEVFDGTSRRSN
jgi:hypothetical protein